MDAVFEIRGRPFATSVAAQPLVPEAGDHDFGTLASDAARKALAASPSLELLVEWARRLRDACTTRAPWDSPKNRCESDVAYGWLSGVGVTDTNQPTGAEACSDAFERYMTAVAGACHALEACGGLVTMDDSMLATRADGAARAARVAVTALSAATYARGLLAAWTTPTHMATWLPELDPAFAVSLAR